MNNFLLSDLLQALGPTASLIFAAWIFLSFLQQRYSDAYERYRALISEFRSHQEHDRRRETLQDQILEYKRRCEQMRRATNIGVVSAIILITALICGAVNTMFDKLSFLKYLTGACAIVGLLLVIWAAVLVIAENSRLQLIIESDLADVPDLDKGSHEPSHVGAQQLQR